MPGEVMEIDDKTLFSWVGLATVWIGSLIAFFRKDQSQENAIKALEEKTKTLDERHTKEFERLMRFFIDENGNPNVVTMPAHDRLQETCQREVHSRIDGIRSDVEAQVTSLNTRIDNVEAKLDRFEGNVDAKLDRLLVNMTLMMRAHRAGKDTEIHEQLAKEDLERLK